MTIVVDVRVCVAGQASPVQSTPETNGDAFECAPTVGRGRVEHVARPITNPLPEPRTRTPPRVLPVREGACGT
jgi:hypothetical protein